MTAIAKRNPSALDIVAEFWGATAPEWVKTLARFCDKNTQAAAARKIGRSASLINQVLKNRYTGDLIGVQARVESAFSDSGVVCPVMGQITGSTCLGHQKVDYNPSNHIAVKLYVACRRCPHNVSRKGTSDVSQ